MRLVVSAALVLGALPLLACGSHDTANGSGSGGSGGASADGSTDSGGNSVASGGASVTTKTGFIGVSSRATAATTVFVNSVGAGFNAGPGGSFAKGCQRNVVGACQIVLCDYADGGTEQPPPGAPENAGVVTISGTAPTFSLAYDAGTSLYTVAPVVPTDKRLFAGGDTITFAAAGGDVRAFSESVVAPSPLTVTSPALPTGAFSLDTSKDLVFAWTGSTVGRLAFNIRTTTASAGTTLGSSFVSCQFDASARTGTIPAAQLANLRKTDAITTALLGTDLSSTKEVVAGDHSIHLAIGSVATEPDGTTQYATSQVTIF